MNDLRTLLHDAAPSAATPPASRVVEDDLARGRRALHRRRARRLGTGTGLVAATAVAALSVVGLGDSSPSPSPGVGGTSTPRAAGVELVAYTGAQPAGFELSKVPVGWIVRDSTPGLLTLAPRDAAQAREKPADGATSLVGTIAVTTQDTGVPDGVQVDDVSVAGRPAAIVHLKGSGDTRALYTRLESGSYLVIQVWDGLGWDNPRIVEFASSVTVTAAATPSFG